MAGVYDESGMMTGRSGDSEGSGLSGFGGGGTVEKQIGTQLDQATIDFLNETAATRLLRMGPGVEQLTAQHYVEYLGIDLEVEPELAWIGREMVAAPMPPNAETIISKSNIVYFHDTENDYYTVEHPLTQRYLKILERERTDLLALRTKPSVNGLLFKQPDMLFQKQFRNLQIPCQDCGVLQSTVKCEQCLMSFCTSCYDCLHSHCEGPRKNHTKQTTAVGSYCSACSVKKPQVFCASCEDYFCFKCFETMHGKGERLKHKSLLVNVSDGEIIEPQQKCEECEDGAAAFHCDYCQDNFCIPCFWKCHFNGHRRNHTVSKIIVNPLCNQCNATRATVFCEQCQELLCTECFTFVHAKGNRQLHLFVDAMNVLLLLERLDPSFQEHMRRARPRVLWAITQLQGWTRGIECRRYYRRRRELVTKIQRRWRGAMTRRKLLSMLDHYKWRRKQINNYFLPKTASERRLVKQKCSAMLATKEVNSRASKQTLRELQSTVMDTAHALQAANVNEDAARTQQIMMQHLEQGGFNSTSGHTATRTGPKSPKQPALPVYKPYEDSRFPADESLADASPSRQRSELTRTDVREARDMTLRQVMNIDDRVDKDALSRRPISPARQEETSRPGQEIALRGATSYRDTKKTP